MRSVILLVVFLLLCVTLSHAQVGIGTTTPKAFFNVLYGRTVLFGYDTTGTLSSQNIFYPKLIWYGNKGAFRAGGVSGGSDNFAAWDSGNTGIYSFAGGLDTQASGNYATSLGYRNTASNLASTSMGYYTTARGTYATSMGYFTSANGSASTSMGFQSTASGATATSTGFTTSASGDYSTAMGANVTTNKMTGSFIVGDWSPTFYNNSAANQMMMRFSGGYVLYSSSPSNQSTALGVELATNSNAWSTLSDSSRKENFRSVDGNLFLRQIANMRLGSWNYKGQDTKLYRHYGPMAQEFFAAFGHDELGTIGEEKSINQADFDGVNLIAIQALIQENQQLKARLTAAEEKQQSTQARLDKIEAKLQEQTTSPALTLKP